MKRTCKAICLLVCAQIVIMFPAPACINACHAFPLAFPSQIFIHILMRERSNGPLSKKKKKKPASVICSSETAGKFPLAATPHQECTSTEFTLAATPRHERGLMKQSGRKGTPANACCVREEGITAMHVTLALESLGCSCVPCPRKLSPAF